MPLKIHNCFLNIFSLKYTIILNILANSVHLYSDKKKIPAHHHSSMVNILIPASLVGSQRQIGIVELPDYSRTKEGIIQHCTIIGKVRNLTCWEKP